MLMDGFSEKFSNPKGTCEATRNFSFSERSRKFHSEITEKGFLTAKKVTPYDLWKFNPSFFSTKITESSKCNSIKNCLICLPI